MTPEQHYAKAETLVAQATAQPDAMPVHHVALAVYAVAHALLAQGAPLEASAPEYTGQDATPIGRDAWLLMLLACATFLVGMWLVTR